MGDKEVTWQSTAVAIALVLAVCSITIAAIIKYDVDSVLKIWSSLGTIVGIISGAVVTYFFARQSIDVLKRELYKERYARTHSGSYPPES